MGVKELNKELSKLGINDHMILDMAGVPHGQKTIILLANMAIEKLGEEVISKDN